MKEVAVKEVAVKEVAVKEVKEVVVKVVVEKEAVETPVAHAHLHQRALQAQVELAHEGLVVVLDPPPLARLRHALLVLHPLLAVVRHRLARRREHAEQQQRRTDHQPGAALAREAVDAHDALRRGLDLAARRRARW